MEHNNEDLERMLNEETLLTFNNECVRKKLNMSKSSNKYKFDHPNFSPEILLNDIENRSPKLESLIKNIEKLDKMDMEKDGHKYKHFIFSDLKSSSSGAKLIASVLIANGYHLGYTAEQKENANPENPPKKLFGKMSLLSENELLKHKNKNLYLLSSVGVYDQPISVANKKDMLKTYNKRPDNIHGELIRFIVMDSGYKEGIDLFDIKYIHIFEPAITNADQKQVIGRGTRTCGQKGLEFHPTMGWPLKVFVYDYEFPEKLQSSLMNTSTGIELYMKSMNLDIHLLNFTYELENIVIEGSVDYDLNKNIHSFSIPSMESLSGGAKLVVRKDLPPIVINTRGDEMNVYPGVPKEQMKYKELRKYINENFGEFEWDPVKMENLCVQKGGSEIINYTPTQNFVRHYFTPQNPLKGMLLNHSVGTGKTCSAIAAASSTFEQQGYTILWVTRTTLKSDIWKNMFDQVCNEQIRKMMQNGVVIPTDNKQRMKLLSKSWRVRPISYKQFSNLVSKENAYYNTLVKMNGEADPLRKTLLIIDEAHKLYGGDLSGLEQPDMAMFHKAVMNSYMVSQQNSVRLLLMTATPITKSPMELIQLLNLFKLPDQQIPHDFDTFRGEYLNEEGHFTKKGHDDFLDVIAGHISYLNREKDARQFSQPIIKKINIPIAKETKEIEKFDKKYVREYLKSEVFELKKEIQENKMAMENENNIVDKDDFGFMKQRCDAIENKKVKSKCVKIVNANIRDIINEVKDEKNLLKEHIHELQEVIKNANLFKKERMAEISENHENLEEGYNHYKESVYYNLKSKCGKTVKTMKDLKELIDSNPDFTFYDEEMKNYEDRIKELRTNLKDSIQRYKNKIKQIQSMLKMDYNDLEKSTLRLVIKDERKRLRQFTAKETKNVDKEITTLNKSIKKTDKKRKKYFGKLRKTVKKQINDDKRMTKKMRKAELKIEKQLKREQGYRIDVENEHVKELVEKHERQIDDEIEDAIHELEEEREEKEREKTEKQARKAEEKKRERETRREAEKANKKTRKVKST